jgi:hypothetical protein
MIQLNTTSMWGAQDPLDGSLADLGKKAAADFQHAMSGALSRVVKDLRTEEHQVALSMAPTSAPASASPAVSPFSIAATSNNSSVTSTSTSAPAPATASGTSGDHTQSFDDAYWAKQPPAVQALRNMGDYDQRTQLAAQLTAQGYDIDVPIMVWGWDPGKITAARQSYGYTWVPSAMQPAITEAPGLSSPGIQAYDPTHPPKDAITV